MRERYEAFFADICEKLIKQIVGGNTSKTFLRGKIFFIQVHRFRLSHNKSIRIVESEIFH